MQVLQESREGEGGEVPWKSATFAELLQSLPLQLPDDIQVWINTGNTGEPLFMWIRIRHLAQRIPKQVNTVYLQ